MDSYNLFSQYYVLFMYGLWADKIESQLVWSSWGKSIQNNFYMIPYSQNGIEKQNNQQKYERVFSVPVIANWHNPSGNQCVNVEHALKTK